MRPSTDTAAPLRTTWASVFADRDWIPEITTVVPVVRWALLVRMQPPLTDDLTTEIHRAVDEAWRTGWREEYRAAVAKCANVDIDTLEIDEHEVVRRRYDGDTPMIDLPKVRTKAGSAVSFDLRNCAALCLKNYSSKFWSRVGLPYEVERGIDAENLSPTLDSYRALATSMAEWLRDELFRLIDRLLENRERSNHGALEVTTVGLQVRDQTQADFDAWLFKEIEGESDFTASMIVHPNLEQDDLRRFITEAANLDYDVRELSKREPDAFWMAMPMAVEVENGDLASRHALYLIRPVGDVVQIVGVGLDDSRAGDFASEVALKVSRIVASRF